VRSKVYSNCQVRQALLNSMPLPGKKLFHEGRDGTGFKARKGIERNGFDCWTCLGSSKSASSQKPSSAAAGGKIQKLASI
jgi:hypothetical protein